MTSLSQNPRTNFSSSCELTFSLESSSTETFLGNTLLSMSHFLIWYVFFSLAAPSHYPLYMNLSWPGPQNVVTSLGPWPAFPVPLNIFFR